MRLETRIAKLFDKVSIRFKEKVFFFQNSFYSSIFFLFLGFLSGNLFGTFLSGIRGFIYWDGFIVSIIIFFIEIVSYITYHKEGRLFFFIWRFSSIVESQNRSIRESQSRTPFSSQNVVFWKCLNFFKIGLMLGFFIDAFKVGS